jgi:hypothetical protein
MALSHDVGAGDPVKEPSGLTLPKQEKDEEIFLKLRNRHEQSMAVEKTINKRKSKRASAAP